MQSTTADRHAPLSDYLSSCERRYIEGALDASENQIGKAAIRLGISRKNLWEKMKRLGMSER
jgi:DNA-binding NtrC family response regulator